MLFEYVYGKTLDWQKTHTEQAFGKSINESVEDDTYLDVSGQIKLLSNQLSGFTTFEIIFRLPEAFYSRLPICAFIIKRFYFAFSVERTRCLKGSE